MIFSLYPNFYVHFDHQIHLMNTHIMLVSPRNTQRMCGMAMNLAIKKIYFQGYALFSSCTGNGRQTLTRRDGQNTYELPAS